MDISEISKYVGQLVIVSKFNDEKHLEVLSEDGSYTAYSKEYDEHYHSTKDGALKESYKKHIIPAFSIITDKDEINILDICYGLGFNTLATLSYYRKNALSAKLNIYSPELDENLVKSLKEFRYPKEFDEFKEIIFALSEDGIYESDDCYIELFIGDAREYVKRFKDKFDIVYQDAFSPTVNPVLWTQEYFNDIKNSMKKDGVLTTALKTRLALYKNGFNIYINSGDDFRNSTIASISKLTKYKEVDMPHKISCNPNVEPLRD
jgi:tRNA U34 5-methylaminomethyl-2-thiouridine-forming methyltransferase MnmC